MFRVWGFGFKGFGFGGLGFSGFWGLWALGQWWDVRGKAAYIPAKQ